MKTETADKLVIDASVLGAVFFREPEAEFLEKKISRHVWIAPTLIDYEMGSIFLKKLKLNSTLREELEQCFEIYCKSSLEKVEIPIGSAITLAEKYNLTVYDASYFWLAQELNIPLLTLDKKLSTAWLKK